MFIYMELVEGRTLQDGWDELNNLDKTYLCDQLSQIINNIRSLEQDPSDQYIGMVHAKMEMAKTKISLSPFKLPRSPERPGLCLPVISKSRPVFYH